MTNIVVTSYVQLKSLMIALMIADATEVARKMEIPENLPIRSEAVTMATVTSPTVIPILGLGGVFNTTDWAYSYPKSGKLAYIIRKKPDFWKKADPDHYRPLAIPA